MFSKLLTFPCDEYFARNHDTHRDERYNFLAHPNWEHTIQMAGEKQRMYGF